VLGSGIDVVYPASNRGLYGEIIEHGGVVSSEFPPGTPPEAWRFPTRNHTNTSQAHPGRLDLHDGFTGTALPVEAGP